MTSKIRWGVLGCAGIAEEQFIPGILQSDNGVLHAISSRGKSDKLKLFSRKFKPVKVYESYDDVICDPDVDVVYIPLPNKLHFEWTMKALKNKKPVLCEKPMGINAKEVKKMFEAARKNNVLLMEAFAYRQSPLTKKVKEMVDKGVIGEIKFFEGSFCLDKPNSDNVRLSHDLHGGGFMDIGCYPLNLIRYLTGKEPVKISACGYIDPEFNVDVDGCVLLQFENGVNAVLKYGWEHYRKCGYTVVGTKGIITVPYMFNVEGITDITLESGGKKKTITINNPHNYKLEVENFGKVLQGKDDPLITFEDTVGNILVIETALRQMWKMNVS